MTTMRPCWEVLEEVGNVVVGFGMARVRIVHCASQCSFHRQHYAPLGVERKHGDWSVRRTLVRMLNHCGMWKPYRPSKNWQRRSGIWYSSCLGSTLGDIKNCLNITSNRLRVLWLAKVVHHINFVASKIICIMKKNIVSAILFLCS